MEVSNILAVIDAEIAKLQQARALLAGSTTSATPSATPKAGRGRPKGSKNAVKAVAAVATKKTAGKRRLTPEGRKAIADAMKKRWAERRKQAVKAVAK